jgi:hypothetical protein
LIDEDTAFIWRSGTRVLDPRYDLKPYPIGPLQGLSGGWMRDLPNPFWAILCILLACAVGVYALHSQSSNAASVITMASSIVTGAFGYIQGHHDGSASDLPPGSTQTANVQTQVGDPKP